MHSLSHALTHTHTHTGTESNSRNLGGSGHLQTIPAGDEDGLNPSQAGGPIHGTVGGVTRGSFVPNRPGVRIGGQFGGHPSQQQPLPRAINSTLNMDPAANLNSSSGTTHIETHYTNPLSIFRKTQS